MSVGTHVLDPESHLEPAEAAERKLAQRRRLQVVEYSLARFIGNALRVRRLFEPCHNSTLGREAGGSGLGLAAAG